MDQPPVAFAYPMPNQPPRRTGWIVYSVIVSFFFLVSVLANCALLVFCFHGSMPKHAERRTGYLEQFVDGDPDARDKVAVIYLTGIITSDPESSFGEENMVDNIKEQLRAALDDEHVKAIVLRINSPGGEVVASDAIYKAVADAREVKPIVVSMDSVAASGAYYIAVGADYIFATDMTITGSIGVILESFTFTDLMGKVGIKSYTFKSGKYKDVLNPTREPTEDEKQLVQTLIMEVYDKFVGIVAEERDMCVEELKDGMADGRIMSGKQALAAGFVDGIGYFEDAVEKAKELAKIKKARAVRYVTPFSWRNVFRLLGQNDHAKIQLELTPNQLKLQSGKLYFLPAYMFQ
ncbi:MAG: signal peptide peptidase SppA [Verrucomicrobiia bacterium]